MVEEVLDAQKPHCPPEYFNIPIPENHMYRNQTGLDQLPLLRTRYDPSTGTGPNNPRQQVYELFFLLFLKLISNLYNSSMK